MGKAKKPALRVEFDRKVKLEFHGAKITSDAGLPAYRELDDALGLTETASEHLEDYRTGKNTQHSLLGMLRQAVYGRLAGYEDVNDAERLRHDPAMRTIVGEGAGEKPAASTSEMGRFETEILSQRKNVRALMPLPGKLVDRAQKHRPLKSLTLDMDSSVSKTYGEQQGTAYNGHFARVRHHPLFVFNQHGDMENAMLRQGNQHSAKYWKYVLMPVVERYRHLSTLPRFFRGDAAFAIPGLYQLLEMENFLYAIRLKANPNLEKKIAHLLTRPVGRPSIRPKMFHESFEYQAAGWNIPRRVVAKVEWHNGELFPRVGFIVTNMKGHAKKIVRFYNKRGTSEQWIQEGKNAVKWTKLSCKNFRDNQVRLQLFTLAYNLGNFLRTLVLPRSIKHWTLTTMREKLIKIGAKMVTTARYVYFQMAETAVPRELFASILSQINGLRLLAVT